jgi:Cu-Zn family superoxide dismutase
MIFLLAAWSAAVMLTVGSAQADRPVSAAVADPDPIRVTLRDGAGREIGRAVLTAVDEGVAVKIEVKGLTPGFHGLHIHEHGRCEGPTFESAGAHFNPTRAQHGYLHAAGPHAGDLPNLLADASGAASAEWVTNRLTLAGDAADSLLRGSGTALIIHAGPDDYRTDPAGNAGARVACGVIRAK